MRALPFRPRRRQSRRREASSGTGVAGSEASSSIRQGEGISGSEGSSTSCPGARPRVASRAKTFRASRGGAHDTSHAPQRSLPHPRLKGCLAAILDVSLSATSRSALGRDHRWLLQRRGELFLRRFA